MKQIKQILTVCFLLSAGSIMAQSTEEVYEVQGGGSMGKKTILPKITNLSIAQVTVLFKKVSTKEFFKNERGALGGRKHDGGSMAMRATAFLDFSDGEMTEADYREITDHYYTSLNKELEKAGIGTIKWDAITASDFYTTTENETDKKGEAEKKGHSFVTYNANGGKTLASYNPYIVMNMGFGMGKLKKAAKMTDEVGAPQVFIHTVLDFADIFLDGDVKTRNSVQDHSLSQGFKIVKSEKKYTTTATAYPNVKVAGGNTWEGRTEGGRLLFVNDKLQSDYIYYSGDVASSLPYTTEITQDPNRKAMQSKNIFAKDFNYEPVIMVTTKQKYKAAAKSALENSAKLLAVKIKSGRS